MEGEFQSWQAGRSASTPAVALESVDDGTVMLCFADGAARVSLAPVEDSSFFAEGLDDPEADVEEWLTEVNGVMMDKPSLPLAGALDLLVAKMPRRFRDSDMAAEEDEEQEEFDDDDIADDLDDDLMPLAEAGESRTAIRAAYSEDRQWESMADAAASQGSRQASQVLMREMRALLQLKGEGSAKALEIEMVDDSLYHWTVRMHASGFPNSCPLRRELQDFGAHHSSGLAAVVMEVRFPSSYPMAPPFIRVVRPRFRMHTGHVTIGGSICMQLLTPSGWLPTVSLENVFVSIRSEMIEGGGRLDTAHANRDYSVAEAKEAFNRVASRYGWLR